MLQRQRAAVKAGKSITNLSSEEKTDEEDDSVFDDEMQPLSDEEESTANEKDSETEEEESDTAKEEEPTAEEEEPTAEEYSGYASHEISVTENETVTGDFEDDTSRKWIIAYFSVGRARKLYIAKVVRSPNNDSLEVMFLRKKTKASFSFPKRKDINLISSDDVLKELPQPTKRSTSFSFPTNFFSGIKP